MKCIALILAGGYGERLSSATPKQFLELNQKSILTQCLSVFESHKLINEIVLVLPSSFSSDQRLVKEISNNCKKLKVVVSGGKSRQESSRIAIETISESEAYVLIHDAVRPFISAAIINELHYKLTHFKAIVPVLPINDTLYQTDGQSTAINLVDRKTIIYAQTPQAFHLSLIRQAHSMAKNTSIQFTDDIGMVLHLGLSRVHTIPGDPLNFKITSKLDYEYAKFLIQQNHDDTPLNF